MNLGKNTYSGLLVLILIVSCAYLASCESASNRVIADTALLNGQFYTLNKNEPWAGAIGILDGTIIFVGSTEDINPYIGSETEVIDLEGKFAMPSFVESHLHPVTTAYDYLFRATLYDLTSHSEYIQVITEFAEENSELDGIMGAGFDTQLYDSLWPQKASLDSIDATRPIGIISNDIHAMWVNSKVFEMLGWDASTPNPPGGVIVRDPVTGEPSGLLLEMPAMLPAWELFPVPTKDEYKSCVLWIQNWLNRQGITTAHDAWVELDPAYYQAFDELAENGELTTRFRGSWFIDPEGEYPFLEDIEYAMSLSEQLTHPHFQVNSFKFLADGVVEAVTALLAEPYTHLPGEYGIRYWQQNDMVSAFNLVDEAGYQIHVHVIGDSATTYTLDVIEEIQETTVNRHSLAHLQLVKPEDIDRMSELGISAHLSPYWMTMFQTYWDCYLPYLGSERANNSYPTKSLVDSGVNITIASDLPTSEPDIMLAIYDKIKPRGRSATPCKSMCQLGNNAKSSHH